MLGSGRTTTLHPSGVKARPWDVQKISRIGQHVEGVRKPPPHHEEVRCVKIGERERAQTLTVRQEDPRRAQRTEWTTDSPYTRSSEAFGSHHHMGTDALGQVDLSSERRKAEQKKGVSEDTLRWAPRPNKPRPVAPAPPPIEEPDPADAALREVQRRAARLARSEITEPPQRGDLRWDRSNAGRTDKGLRAEALAKMRERVDQGGSPHGGADVGRRPQEPGDWYVQDASSNKQKLERAVDELMRRQPGLSRLEAVQKIGVEMERHLNAPNALAEQHFRARDRRFV